MCFLLWGGTTNTNKASTKASKEQTKASQPPATSIRPSLSTDKCITGAWVAHLLNKAASPQHHQHRESAWLQHQQGVRALNCTSTTSVSLLQQHKSAPAPVRNKPVPVCRLQRISKASNRINEARPHSASQQAPQRVCSFSNQARQSVPRQLQHQQRVERRSTSAPAQRQPQADRINERFWLQQHKRL